MDNPTKHEIAAIMATSDPAGAYLENIGKTDLATMSQDEWMNFLEVVCTAFSDKMMELAASGEPPF
jgi:archaellum component FlaD/FlaE